MSNWLDTNKTMIRNQTVDVGDIDAILIATKRQKVRIFVLLNNLVSLSFYSALFLYTVQSVTRTIWWWKVKLFLYSVLKLLWICLLCRCFMSYVDHIQLFVRMLFEDETHGDNIRNTDLFLMFGWWKDSHLRMKKI